MLGIERCPECGVPRQIIDEHLWLNSGVIVLKRDQLLRMAFVESENLDPLFRGIEELIGVPIEHIVIDTERKGTRDYFTPLIPREVKDMIKSLELPLDAVQDAVITTAKINGLGRYEPAGYRLERDDDDYFSTRIHDAYSLLLTLGDLAGACEAVVEREHGKVTYEEVSPGVYEITAHVSGILEELRERLERKEYHLREGDIELAKCDRCGGPAALSGFKWDLNRGVIVNARTSRKMAILHPSVLDPIFEELEEELGETIPRMVVEAQRRFAKTGFYSIGELGSEQGFRTQLALRGMGNLRELNMDATGLRMRLDNVCMHLMVVGMVQGLFELSFDTESEVDWELSDEGDLQVEVRPKA